MTQNKDFYLSFRLGLRLGRWFGRWFGGWLGRFWGLRRRTFVKGLLIVTMAAFVASCSVFRSEGNFAAVNLKPNTPEYYEFIALSYYQRRKYRQAIHYYNIILDQFSERSERYDTDLAWATYEIGFCYYKMKRYQDAYAQFELVIANYRDWGAVTLARQRLRSLKERFPKQFQNQSS